MRGLSKAPLPPPVVLNWVKLFETIVNGPDYLAFDLCGAFFKLRTIMRQYARFSGSQFNRGSVMYHPFLTSLWCSKCPRITLLQ